MTEHPEIKPLSRTNRSLVFVLLLAVFAVGVPIIVFYATGYRYDFLSDSPAIKATGGIYISSESDEHSIFLDEELVEELRVFRSAAYIQGLTPGIHRVHVQGEDVQTWVKELPVYPHIVTEVDTFNVPLKPQVRPIMKYLSKSGDLLYLGSSSTLPFSQASSTKAVVATTSTNISTLVVNPEHEFINSLFATTSATSTSLVDRFIGRVTDTFQFSSDSTASSSVGTTTVYKDSMVLFEYKDDIYAAWLGDTDDIPYYFCVPSQALASTTDLYGAHVTKSLATVLDAITESELIKSEDNKTICRDRVRIDDQNKEFLWFSFLPSSADHVLFLLSDGLYVTEIDDRSWQNSQLLYPGDDLYVVVDGGQIFIRDNQYFAEVFTEIVN